LAKGKTWLEVQGSVLETDIEIEMKNIVFVIGTLRAGGAERVIINLANHFCTLCGYTVTLITHRAFSAYSLDSKIHHVYLYRDEEVTNSVFNKIYRRLNYISRITIAIRSAKPSVVICFLRGMNWRIILLCVLLRVRVIASEHTNHLAERGFFSWLERRIIYKLASNLIVLSRFDENYYSKFLSAVCVIPNPLSFSPSKGHWAREKKVLAAGGVDRWEIKGFDNLLRVFSQISSRYPDWRLAIAGEGDAGKVVLMQLAETLGISDKVDFLGFVPDLDREMRLSEIFVLSSRYEGFSMVLLEAMSQGCACAAFDCVAGPGELISNEVTGLLVEDQNCEAMVASICRLIENPELRRELADRAHEESKNYCSNLIGALWEKVM
jgi:GalNAc-alpha-(1->4)-GalNAc-alpha-(1->3)-diNAcBac-PP-undecaprenol alpha-1,4-N-acetyl-D-galactosaminyltransferase